MRDIRIIPRLDIKGSNVINTIQLEGLKIVGCPNKLSKKYSIEGADELLIIDQVASLYNRNNLIDLIKKFTKDIFIPITVGGGIRSVEDARSILKSGADKVAINTAATLNPSIITDLANEFGSQCVVASIPCKKKDNSWEVYTEGGRQKTNLEVFEWSKQLISFGAGELLITSVDNDGMRNGFDIELMKGFETFKNIPIIASGGLGNSSHAIKLLNQTNCSALAVADFLHMNRGGGIKEIKNKLIEYNYKIRL
jgi:cyclase